MCSIRSCLSPLLLLPLTACLHTVPRLSPEWRPDEPGIRASAEALRQTVQSLVDARVNLRRIDAAEQRARGYALPVTREGIDWFSMQDNLVSSTTSGGASSST
ncbi:MAG: hypothetical protein Q8L48_19820 [Archangium sp.]|nr:hypothetical protein [Archangium sp.]